MPLKLFPASLKDAEEIAAIMFSLSSSERINLEFKDCEKKEWLAWNVRGARAEIEACEKSGGEAIVMKVVEYEERATEEKIVGFAVWVWSEKGASFISSSKSAIPFPAGVNLSLRQRFISSLNKLEYEYSPKGPYYKLYQVAIAPSYQRRGIGRQLIKYGLEKADRVNVQCYLSAAPGRDAMYNKMGFAEVGRMQIPLDEFGGSSIHVHVAMVRKPRCVSEE